MLHHEKPNFLSRVKRILIEIFLIVVTLISMYQFIVFKLYH